jgi:hypothetical protein
MKAIASRFGFVAALVMMIFAQSVIAAVDENTPVGVWEGKWDGTWKVQFTVSKGEKGTYRVIYEWEENLGQPMSKETEVKAEFKDGVLKVGDIDIKYKEGGSAVATGKFKKPRTANLKKRRE